MPEPEYAQPWVKDAIEGWIDTDAGDLLDEDSAAIQVVGSLMYTIREVWELNKLDDLGDFLRILGDTCLIIAFDCADQTDRGIRY